MTVAELMPPEICGRVLQELWLDLLNGVELLKKLILLTGTGEMIQRSGELAR